MNISAVVVTYNRKEMLMGCVEKILSQSVSVKNLYIIDNASTDGTKDDLGKLGVLDDSRVLYFNTGANLGGAGGFYFGLDKVKLDDTDWVWIMDDDVFPEENALEELLIHSDESFSYLASCVYGMNGEAMNVPVVNTCISSSGYPDWYFNLKNNMVKITSATFVSLLINKKAVREVGLPCKDYFIWGDDTEYTLRLTKYFGPAYIVGTSSVVHMRKIIHSLRIEKEDNFNRISNAFYLFRNRLINAKLYKSRTEQLSVLIKTMGLSVVSLFHPPYRFLKFRVIWKAIFAYFREWKKYKKFIDEQRGTES